ncbi:MAG: leucyl aminopeptidase [Burkholderiaceae bacterium]|jgi:leucyl aminopeptidase|nr:leucyl aminopeptidase [Burkholderiaceae bacterium]
MDFALKALGLDEASALPVPALVALVGEGFRPGGDALSAFIERARARGDFKTEAGAHLVSHGVPGMHAERVLLLGIGDSAPARVKKAIGAAAGFLKSARFADVTFCFAQDTCALTLEAVVLAIRDALYLYTATKTTHSKLEPSRIEHITIGVPDLEGQSPLVLQAALTRANAVGEGIALAREWANRPANHATPTLLAKVAQALTELPRIDCEVLGPKEIAKLGMGAFLAVAQGSAQEPRFIVLRYQGADKHEAPVALVGKGITFDSGGISLKPGPEMDEMKFDMSGAASVLGAFRALAQLRPTINVVGLIPATENLPGGRAVKPGDVVQSLSGQTIEILNTDAEGRLVLCDALTYAERFKPRAVIDIATLTGACMIALGGVRSGLFANDDALAEALAAAGERALDLCWRMPLDDEYAEGLKSHFADVANVAGRPAGSVTAAKFLQRFASRWPWAHLDIAGTAWKNGPAKGATGRPVGLLVHYLLALADDLAVQRAADNPPKAAKGKKARKA